MPQELFDWTNVAILVHSSKVDGLGKALEEADEEEMRDAVRRVKALFTYEAVVHYIAAFVNEVRRRLLGLISALLYRGPCSPARPSCITSPPS